MKLSNIISILLPATQVLALAVPESTQADNSTLVKRGNSCDRSRSECSAPLMFFSQVQHLGKFSYVSSNVRLPKYLTSCTNSLSLEKVGSIKMTKGIGEDDDWGCKVYVEKNCKGKEMWVEGDVEFPELPFRYKIKSFRCWHKGTYDADEEH